MSPMAFICTTPDEQEDDLKSLGGLLRNMDYDVFFSKDLCHPQGQKTMRNSLLEGEVVVAVCRRRLGREIFERNFFPRTEYFSYAMEGEPRELASQIHGDVTLRTMHKVLAPAPVQKVLVVGGGVGGVYAALDLAEQGYPVSLVESDPSIGGIMAALDKTFPTMDCSI
ncbi:MAG: FAD-dependent oxidoreductase [Candidatus Geothermincolia bacterium]